MKMKAAITRIGKQIYMCIYKMFKFKIFKYQKQMKMKKKINIKI